MLVFYWFQIFASSPSPGKGEILFPFTIMRVKFMKTLWAKIEISFWQMNGLFSGRWHLTPILINNLLRLCFFCRKRNLPNQPALLFNNAPLKLVYFNWRKFRGWKSKSAKLKSPRKKYFDFNREIKLPRKECFSAFFLTVCFSFIQHTNLYWSSFFLLQIRKFRVLCRD